MRNPTRTSLGVIVVLAMTTFTAANAGEELRTPWGKLFAPRGFNTSGEFSGILSGNIEVGGILYRLDPNATIYELGNGPLAIGDAIAKRHVFLSGTRKGSTDLIYSVVVRPASESISDGSNPSSHLSVSDGSEPQ